MLFRKRRIYADAAAATPISKAAMSELARVLPLYGNPGALHAEGQEAKKELEKARKIIAESIGAHADEVVFTASGTEANNLAFTLAAGHAITTAMEHPSVLEPLRNKKDLALTELATIEELKEAITAETTLVSVQMVNSEVGTVHAVRDIAKVLRKQERKIYFHTDAAQAPLWLHLNVEKLGVDMMTLDGQKICGPKGVGALYIRRGTPVRALIHGGGQEQGLRSGTENVAQAAAFAAALRAAQAGVEERAARVAEVRDFLWGEIQNILPDAVLNGPSIPLGTGGEPRVANNINVSIPGLDGQMAAIAMDREGIAVGTRSACSTGEEEPSHVLRALGVPDELAACTIRITVLPDITRAEATRIATTLRAVAQRYRQA
jgi:cysteine desulfurase